jgi:hypothetical protein
LNVLVEIKFLLTEATGSPKISQKAFTSVFNRMLVKVDLSQHALKATKVHYVWSVQDLMRTEISMPEQVNLDVKNANQTLLSICLSLEF